MTPTITTVFQDALRLSEADRGELAARLLETLEPEAEPGVEEAWAEEIKARLEDYRAGRAKPIPWSEARKLIFSDDDVD